MGELLTRSSNLHRRKLCPGSGWAEHGIPEAESIDAAEGTLLHRRMAHDPAVNKVPLTAEQEAVLETALESRNRTIEQIVADQPGFSASFQYEVELVLHDGLEPILMGHCDLWGQFSNRCLFIEDEKFGRIPVEPADTNLQLSTYAVMGWLDTGIFPVYVSINQPRLDREHRLTIARYDLAQLKAAEEEIRSIIAASEEKDAKRIPGESQCRYCRALGTNRCTESQAILSELSAMTVHPPGELVDNATLESLYDKCGLAEKLIGQIKAEMKRRLEVDPNAFGGRIVLKASTSHPITNTPLLFQRLKDKGARQDEIDAICPAPTKGDLEELLRKVTGLKGKALESAKKELLDGLTTPKPKAPSLERKAA